MPRKPSGNFDQQKYMAQWQKEHMTIISARYTNDFAKEFKEACKVLGISQSDVIRQAMIQTIEKAKQISEE